jgi:hypothetical protein
VHRDHSKDSADVCRVNGAGAAVVVCLRVSPEVRSMSIDAVPDTQSLRSRHVECPMRWGDRLYKSATDF